MLIGHLALIAAALFSGAAIYINFAEQPARLKLDDRSLLAEWKPSYQRGTMMQAPLAVAGGLLGLAAWWMTGRRAFALGGLLMLANLPWTLLGVMPTNRVLMRMEAPEAGPQSRGLILKWGGLHAVRSVFGICATVAFLAALSE